MCHRHAAGPSGPPVLDLRRIRKHFDFPATGRVVTNNAASTQPPRELIELYRSRAPWCENVHRGQSSASQRMTAMFEESYDTIATWLGAPNRRSIVTYRNATEAINAVMYSLLSEFRDGDNVVTTMMEHNSNFVPWYASGPSPTAAATPSPRVRRGHCCSSTPRNSRRAAASTCKPSTWTT